MSEELKAYLLGGLTPEERSRLEERMFSDDEFFNSMLDAEHDLDDAYTAGELSPGEAAQFEARTARMDSRRERMAVARGLLANRRRAEPGRSKRFSRIVSRSVLVAAAGLAAVFAAIWLYQPKTATRVPTGQVASQLLPRNVISIFLTSTVMRGSNTAQTIKLPKTMTDLQMTIGVAAVDPKTTLRAELRSAAGDLAWQGAPQGWEGNSPVFLIPAEQAPDGAAELDVFSGPDRRLRGVYQVRFERF